ncbi:MAG: chromosomal replication initiator protein [Rickettsiales bacterium]|jgi:chromosomal replication initiator protein
MDGSQKTYHGNKIEMLTNIDKKNNIESPKICWEPFLSSLKGQFDQQIFSKWFSGLELYSISQSEVIMSVPSKFIRDWLTREYFSVIKSSWLKEISSLKKFSIIHIEKESQNSTQSDKKIVSLSKHDNVFSLGTELNPKFTFDNFVTGKCNNLATKAAKIIAGEENEDIATSDVNPLFLYGGVGLGKTHLGQAIAWHVKENDKKTKAVYLSAERFMHQFVQSIRSKDVVEFKEKFRSIDLLIIDDLQFIIGKDGTQEEMLYTISNLIADGKRVVLICDRSPGDLNNIGEKLKSRMSAGMVADFKCPDYSTRLEIIKSKTKTSKQEFPFEVQELLASKINTNVRDLEGAYKKLSINQIFTGEDINLSNANKLLQDLFRNTQKELSIHDIKKEVGNFFSVTIKDLESASRSRNFVRPRQIAMYLAKTLTTKSLAEIGSDFGGKNHATVIHAFKSVEKMSVSDASFASDIRDISDSLSSGSAK